MDADLTLSLLHSLLNYFYEHHPFHRGMFAGADAFREQRFIEGPQKLRFYGRLYGYPKCCTKAFLMRTSSAKEGEWLGTGFMPCGGCAMKIERRGFATFVQHTIQPARQFNKPFPQDRWSF
jgi:hypothetical protein